MEEVTSGVVVFGSEFDLRHKRGSFGRYVLHVFMLISYLGRYFLHNDLLILYALSQRRKRN